MKFRLQKISTNTGTQELAQQLQTSKIDFSRAQTEVSHLRSSVERNQCTETRGADDLQDSREEHVSLVGDHLRHLAEIDRVFDLSGKTRNMLWEVTLSVPQVSDQEIPIY